jgi:hypothetical protein
MKVGYKQIVQRTSKSIGLYSCGRISLLHNMQVKMKIEIRLYCFTYQIAEMKEFGNPCVSKLKPFW